MCGTFFPIFVHITAPPDIDISAVVLYNHSKENRYFFGGIIMKPVFIGNWSYSMPDTKADSEGNIVLIKKLSFGPCEVYVWGLDINNLPYEEYQWCENEYFKDESYFKHITKTELISQIRNVIRVFTENELPEWANAYNKVLDWLNSYLCE